MTAPLQRLWLLITAFALLLAACGPVASKSQRHANSSIDRASVPQQRFRAIDPNAVPTSTTEAGCRYQPLGETMSAQLAKECFRTPDLPAGTYYLGVEAQLADRGAAAIRAGMPAPPTYLGPSVSLSLSPTSVRPGATVTITGHLASPISPQPSVTSICFDGCIDGLHYNGTPVHWISTSEFTTSFVTPRGPWIERSPLRLIDPSAGHYRVSIQCLVVHRGCGLGRGEGSATLTYLASAHPTTPLLSMHMTRLIPGEVTRVGGSIALTSIIGTDQPFVDQFTTVHQLPNDIVAKGVYRLAHTQKADATTVLLGVTKFQVTTPVIYSNVDLKGATNLRLTADPSIFTEAGTSGIAFSCTGPQNQMQMLKGGQVTTINTTGVIHLLEQAGVPSSYAITEPCNGIAALKTSNSGTLIAASYPIAIPTKGPDLTYLPVITTNDGASWRAVPFPSGHSNAHFAGLTATAHAIHMYFTLRKHKPITEVTTDGVHWTQGGLLCPASGPCVRFSPTVAPSSCAMNGAAQAILYSTSQGKTFDQPAWPSSVNACSTNELFDVGAISYLLDPLSQFPLRRSTNGGASWEVVADIPTPAPSTLSLSGLPSTALAQTTLVIPTTGDLVSIGNGGPSVLLAPHAKHWCTIPTTTIPSDVGAAVTGQHNLYLVLDSNTGSSTLTSIALTKLRCRL